MKLGSKTIKRRRVIATNVSQQRIVSRSPADLLLPDTEYRLSAPPPLRSVIPFVYMERGVSRSRRFIDENYERWPIMQRASRARPFFPSFLSSFPFRGIPPPPRYHPPSQIWGVLEEVLVRGGHCLVNLRFTSGWPPSKQPRTTT